MLKELKRHKKGERQKARQKQLKLLNKANTAIYVKGLPDDVAVDELKEFFSKAGVIKSDLDSGEPKVKIYTDDTGRVKGDALISYIKPESVHLAIQMLHDRLFRPHFTLSVEEASFQPPPLIIKKISKNIDNNNNNNNTNTNTNTSVIDK